MSIIEESQLIKGLISAAYHELKNNASTSTEPWYERPEYSEIVDRWTSLANRTLIDDNVDVYTIADVLVSGWFLGSKKLSQELSERGNKLRIENSSHDVDIQNDDLAEIEMMLI